jgi:hypothetical protein
LQKVGQWFPVIKTLSFEKTSFVLRRSSFLKQPFGMVEDINELTVAAAADLVSEQTTKVYIVPVTILIKFCLERRLFEKKTYYDVCITLKKRTRQT